MGIKLLVCRFFYIKNQVLGLAFFVQNLKHRINKAGGGKKLFDVFVRNVFAKQRPGRKIGAEDIAGPVNHHNRVGQAVENGGVGNGLGFQSVGFVCPKTVHGVDGIDNLAGIFFRKRHGLLVKISAGGQI